MRGGPELWVGDICRAPAVRSNGDFEQYWDYHLSQEQRRVHQSLYADNLVPQAA